MTGWDRMQAGLRRAVAIGIGVAALGASRASADTSADFRLEHPGPTTLTWGATAELRVRSTHDQRMAACAFRISASGAGAVRVTQRVSAAPLSHLGANPAAPLADELPVSLSAGESVHEVLLTLAPASPATDGVPAGANIAIATYTLVATHAGTLTLTLGEARAAETQSDAGGALFDATTVAPGAAAVTLAIVGGPDLDGDARVDLRDFATLQRCIGHNPTGACASADADADGDVDSADYAVVQSCLTGPTHSPECGPARSEENP